ncbi:MAG: protein-L-isoaspartate O-methyltransferase [Candidatus Doudnabacteria bacterium RIFCSPHIGHO2_01_FULL_50_11]|uniref:Protein-L-isoaspartate O-methyltransferase n=1 Tax=Candidatus Doudnabacteria bacterium RIFCSPHIGHO2_01_FULL_50_11 TaxID=1817828 RepID=A0A1F5PGI0_9BACT|nr:MAG: protein-L-isoaspartate O-methyltransferase [Candidatus Doudnabacteria bacterium RIFCSPHIGHO2_01_FULL_50_11]HLC45011.1 protein-L-isoaspartate O-methyltransferase [Patescibacteria group bacterium]
MRELTAQLRESGVLKNPALKSAFEQVDRADFVPAALRAQAYEDQALPTVGGQTISQPSTVAFMLEKLDPKPANKILDVGFGSAWTTALLASIAGDAGAVYGLEVRPDVFRFGEQNLKKYNFSNVRLRAGSGNDGWPEHAPYDRILVSAAAQVIPEALVEQLAVGGRMVLPVVDSGAGRGNEGMFNQSIVVVHKLKSGKLHQQKFPGFVFVPLVK